MSILTTSVLKATALASTGVSVTTGASDTFGSWVELIASTSAAIQIDSLIFSPGTANDRIVWQFGVGASGSEVPVGGEILTFDISPGNQKMCKWHLLVPIDGIGSGQRVSIRAKRSEGSGETVGSVVMQYYEGLDSDHLTTRDYAYGPDTVGLSLVVNTTSWANTAWGELLSGVGHEITVLGIAFGWGNVGTVPYEVDVGTGASGAESLFTTFRGVSVQNGFGLHWLPAGYPLTKNTRISCRTRKSGTGNAGARAFLIYLDNTALLTTPTIHRFPPISIAM